MKMATSGQLAKIRRLFAKTPSEQVQDLLASGLLADLRDANLQEVNRGQFRRILGLRAMGDGKKTVNGTSANRARAIMGTNFFGVEEAIAHFKVNPTKAQLAALAVIPYTTEEVLAQCKDTHILVAVFPLSILAVREKAPKSPKTFYSYDNAWYNNELFAKKTGNLAWRLIRKTPVEGSFNKTWDEQKELLAKEEDVPTARELIYAIVGHFLATGTRLFPNSYVRTTDIGSGGFHVFVGRFGAGGLSVNYDWDGVRYNGIGLSSARKSNC